MSVEVPKDKRKLKDKLAYSVRASQAVLQYGVGAMVDFKDRTLMTAAPEYWHDSVSKIHDQRLENILKVEYFGKPGDKDDVKYSNGISYVRFPEWYFCPSCRRFKPIGEWVKEYRAKNTKAAEEDPNMIQSMKCPKCYQDLVVARIIVACPEGHIDDFPWVKWVHCKTFPNPKPICSNPELSIITSSSASEGLEGLIVKCSCGARASLKGAFDPEVFEELDKKTNGDYNFRCAGKHPWKHHKEACNNTGYPKSLQRGSSSVYFPVTESSLVIPPYSSIVTEKIQNSSSYSEYKSILAGLVAGGISEEILETQRNIFLQIYSQKIAQETAIPLDKVKGVLQRKSGGNEDEEYSTSGVKYRAEEYEAITGETAVSSEDYGEFLREGVDITEYNIPYVKSISLIHKVREVQALIGFTRLKPVDTSDESEDQSAIVPIKEPDTPWYPAYDVRGEGIFIEFDATAINNWRSNNEALKDRVKVLNENYKKSFIGKNRPREITGKFLLLHTISHLLIKQLSFECGYSIASLKERIYCSEAADGKEMSGILIYTACGDSEGTLGGLVRQGRADTFPEIFKKAIDGAMVCSNDPVCSLSQGQGRDSLNLSACYSCALIPETSCEEYNTFLDRGVIVGTFDNPELGFFKGIYDCSETSDSQAVTVEGSDDVMFVYMGTGTDLSDTAYIDIWDNLLQWSDDEKEQKLLNELIEKSPSLANKEKPVKNGVLKNPVTQEEFVCDLIWKRSKIALLTSENKEVYEDIQKGNWTCYCLSEEDNNVDEVIRNIAEV